VGTLLVDDTWEKEEKAESETTGAEEEEHEEESTEDKTAKEGEGVEGGRQAWRLLTGSDDGLVRDWRLRRRWECAWTICLAGGEDAQA
jgi:hypothetical protein